MVQIPGWFRTEAARCLPAKSRQGLLVPEQLVGQELDRRGPLQLDVARPVDHTHAAAAQLLLDFVPGDGAPNQRVGTHFPAFSRLLRISLVTSAGFFVASTVRISAWGK